MFREMRKEKNALPAEEAKALLKTVKRAALSVSGDNGYPYVIPINFFYDQDENKIYVHSAKNGHMVDSIRANSKVCLSTWNEGYLEEGDWAYHLLSCTVFGQAKLIEDRKLTEEKMRQFALKYYPTAEEAERDLKIAINGVQLVAIEIEHISGKKVYER